MADTLADDIFQRIYVRIAIQISLKFAPRESNDNMSASVQVMAWFRMFVLRQFYQ